MWKRIIQMISMHKHAFHFILIVVVENKTKKLSTVFVNEKKNFSKINLTIHVVQNVVNLVLFNIVFNTLNTVHPL